MSHSRLWVVTAIIALVVIVSFVLSVPHTRDIAENQKIDKIAPLPEVTVRDSYKKGVHTITGSVLMPNACGSLTAETLIADATDASSTPSIHVNLAITTDDGVCLQLPTPTDFKASVATATARMPIIVTVNGVFATSTMP